jgi:hypothetical protein
MFNCELMRTVKCGRLSIRLWIDAGSACCEHTPRGHADTVASLVLEMADEDDDEVELAARIAATFNGVTAVEVSDEEGDGCRVRFGEEDCHDCD